MKGTSRLNFQTGKLHIYDSSESLFKESSIEPNALPSRESSQASGQARSWGRPLRPGRLKQNKLRGRQAPAEFEAKPLKKDKKTLKNYKNVMPLSSRA